MANSSKYYANSVVWVVHGDTLRQSKKGVGFWEAKKPNVVTLGILQDRIDDWDEELSAIDLREVGSVVKKGESLGTATGPDGDEHELPSPVDGTIVAINPQVTEDPEMIVASCFQEGWLIQVQVESAAAITSLDRLEYPGLG